ncbi:SDR family oxidoreductase [Burkholderia sp. R-69980]|nr:SDR family oxidoreductase [Burkholderia sp. R-69980]
MNDHELTVLAVGATGSIGGHIIDEAISQGHKVRALVRNPGKLKQRPGLHIVVGDLTSQNSLLAAVESVDAIVFTHGTYGSPPDAEAVDYGGVRNVLAALGDKQARIALMTTIAVTDRKGAHDWKRRAERLVRVSGHPYTIVRPGWFDYNDPDQLHLVFLQGDRRQSGTPRDGVVARRQIAKVLIRSLTSDAASRKTFELVAERGPEQEDFDPLFAALDADKFGALDAVLDATNMPLDQEPRQVLAVLDNPAAI